MIQFLIRHFVPDHEQTQQPQVRQRYGVLAAVVGILSNIFLFLIKALVGLLFHSISITADAVNNLSDAGSSVITLLGFKIAGKPADPEHPYGHARMEYISGMVVSFIIILLGLQLMGSSFDKILHPQAVTISVLTYVVLVVSIPGQALAGHLQPHRRQAHRLRSAPGNRCRQPQRRLCHRRSPHRRGGLPPDLHPGGRLDGYGGGNLHHRLRHQAGH